MAEYYPLLVRAVSAQPNATPEIRNSIYERARKALLGQLRAHEPPVAEEDIERESRALDEAIARVEAELRSSSKKAAEMAQASSLNAATDPAQLASAKPPPKPLNLNASVKPSGEAAERTAAILSHRTTERSVLPPGSTRPGAFASKSIRPSAAPELRADRTDTLDVTAPPVERERLPNPIATPAPAVIASEKSEAVTTEPTLPRNGILRKFGRPRAGIPDTGPMPAPAPAGVGETASTPAEPSPADSGPHREATTELASRRSPVRSEAMRPFAPQALEKERRPILAWVLGSVAAIFVIGVAVLAFALRDNPKTLASRTPVPIQTGGVKSPGKIEDRIGAGPTPLARRPSGGAPTRGAESLSGPAAAPASQTPGSNPVAPTAQNPPANTALPVAQRAALLVQAPTADNPHAVATYVGAVVWRLDTVSPGPGQSVALAVRAEINVPDAKFKGYMLLQRNADATLPASHTIELRFSPEPGSPIGDVRQVDTPQMRRENAPEGEPLTGIAAPITTNYFLIGLTNGGPIEARNLELIRTRAWFDVPLLLANGKVAKITFEKGVAGQKVLDEAMASWSK